MRSVLSGTLLLLLIFSFGTLPGDQFFSVKEEMLHYRAKYFGPLSAGTDIPIADVFLSRRRVAQPGETGPLMEDRLTVSSKDHPFVESLYPFRLRFRSLYSPADSTSIAFERYRKTGRTRHEVSWMDQATGKVSRFRRGQEGRVSPRLPLLLSNWMRPASGFRFYKYARHQVRDNLLDQLALLSRVRKLELAEGKVYRFPVTDGKRLLQYRVIVEARKFIEVAGRTRASWKLRFDARRTRKGVTETYHRPVYVWLEDNELRTPVKFESRHQLGRFTIDLLEQLPVQ